MSNPHLIPSQAWDDKKRMNKFLDPKAKETIKKVTSSYREKRAAAIDTTGLSFKEYRGKSKEIRKKVFVDFENNLKEAKTNLQNNGFVVYEAKNANDAIDLFENIIKDTDNIVRAKTNTGKEIGIHKLKKEITETDLGDFIVQMFKQDDQHYVLPAIHLSAQMISDKVKEVYNKDIPADPKKLTRFLCGKIRKNILKADIGVTGTNFFTKTGQIVLLENEGNISLVSRVPKKHIVIAGIDKLTESIGDATALCQTAAIFGTGQPITQYINIISGPSATADIENQLVQGAQGAHEVHVILIDNGRRKMLKGDFAEMLRCINCGACINSCPVYHQMGRSYGGNYIGSKGIIMKNTTDPTKYGSIINSGLFNCTLCGNCHRNCPMGIALPKYIRQIRQKAQKKNFQSKPNKAMISKTKKHGNPFGRTDDKGAPNKLYCC